MVTWNHDLQRKRLLLALELSHVVLLLHSSWLIPDLISLQVGGDAMYYSIKLALDPNSNRFLDTDILLKWLWMHYSRIPKEEEAPNRLAFNGPQEVQKECHNYWSASC